MEIQGFFSTATIYLCQGELRFSVRYFHQSQPELEFCLQLTTDNIVLLAAYQSLRYFVHFDISDTIIMWVTF